MINNTELLKALTINYPNFLDRPLIISPHDVIYDYIFPYKVHPDIITDQKSIITMEFVNFRLVGNTFKSGKVYFYTICHEGLVKTDYGNRYDFIYEQIKTIFDENKNLGIGETRISSTGDLSVSKDYIGNVCVLDITDFK